MHFPGGIRKAQRGEKLRQENVPKNLGAVEEEPGDETLNEGQVHLLNKVGTGPWYSVDADYGKRFLQS